VPRVRVPVPKSTAPDGGSDLGAALVDVGISSGLAAVGITTADVFEQTRRDIEHRKERGLHGGMQFTYRNPDRSTDPSRILPGARSLVVGAWGYRRRDPGPTSSGAGSEAPTGEVARYARSDHYSDLRAALARMAVHLRGLGWRAVVVCDDNALVDRAVAHRAGLGWYGKNTLLLLPGLGSWFVLGSVVTDAQLVPTAPGPAAPHGQGCGRCTRCIRSCPTGALVAPGVLDARRCLAWLLQAKGSFPLEYRQALGTRIYGCDECQQACPINELAERRDPAPVAGEEEHPVDLVALLDADDDELMATYGRWYVPGRDPRYLRRNALVALGNSGLADHPGTERVLRRWLAATDPMIVEHATWAARQLGRVDLVVQVP
jgi:epoxyqueuosine reductase